VKESTGFIWIMLVHRCNFANMVTKLWVYKTQSALTRLVTVSVSRKTLYKGAHYCIIYRVE
jgi:hypothetical protein